MEYRPRLKELEIYLILESMDKTDYSYSTHKYIEFARTKLKLKLLKQLQIKQREVDKQ